MAYDLIVIGGGPAGVTAALRAREMGAERVALVERGPMGGTCTNDGCVPTRVFAKAARLLRDAEQFEEYGLVDAGTPRVDLARLLARTREVIGQIHDKKRLRERLEAAGVAVFADAGDARFTDPHTVALPRRDGESLRGERFILCAGGHARRPDFPGCEHALIHSDLWTLPRLPRSLVVVGGAATGCQIASILRAFGADVTLLETAPRLLPGEDEAVSEAVTRGFARHGIRVVPGINGVERIEKQEGGAGDDRAPSFRVAYRHGGGEEDGGDGPPHPQIEAEAVLVAVGWPGNIAGLGLDAAGIDTEHGYVRVDDRLRTSAAHVFAAGDITGRMMLVQSATDEARVAAENAVNGADRPDAHRIVPHGGFTDPEYGSVGLTEAAAREREPDCVVASIPYAELDRAVIDGRTDGFCKLIASRASGRVLGAHVVGEQALEVVQIVAAAMAGGARVEQLAALELAYPTFAGVVGLAARRIVHAIEGAPAAPARADAARAAPAEWERGVDDASAAGGRVAAGG